MTPPFLGVHSVPEVGFDLNSFVGTLDYKECAVTLSPEQYSPKKEPTYLRFQLVVLSSVFVECVCCRFVYSFCFCGGGGGGVLGFKGNY